MRIAWIMLFSVTLAGSGGRGRDRLEEWARARFEREEVAFGGETIASGVPAKMCRSHYPVARNDDRDRIAAVGLSDRTGTAAGQPGNVEIRAGFAVRDAT